jgi:membrane-bound toxin of toxin-antitoxin system
MKSASSVRIELRPSRIAGAFVVVTHLATAMLIAWLPIAASLRALAAIVVGAHCVWALRSTASRVLRSSIVSAELAADRRVTLVRRDGRRISGRALADSYVGERIATLIVRRDGSWRSDALWLLPDMAAKEDLRRFRVLLRLGREEGEP